MKTIEERLERMEHMLSIIEARVEACDYDPRIEEDEEYEISPSRNLGIYCSFCGLGTDDVTDMIAGPSVFICDQCIALCNEIIKENMERRRGNSSKI